MTEIVRYDCNLEEYNPYNYEYHIMFQASGHRYYLTCLDECYCFEYDEFVTVNSGKVVIAGKEYESPGGFKHEGLKRFEGAMTVILRHVIKRKLKYVSFMMIMAPDEEVPLEPNKTIFIDPIKNAYCSAGCRGMDIRIDMFYCNSGINWHNHRTVRYMSIWWDNRKKRNGILNDISENNAREAIEDMIGATDEFMDPQTKFVKAANKFIEARALEAIRRGELEVFNDNVDAAITRWKSQFTKDLQANTGQRDRVYRILKGETLQKNKNLLLLLFYELRMTSRDVKTLLRLAGLEYDADNKQENILLYLIEFEIYKYKERELEEALDELGIADIYELAKFTDDEE